MWTRHVERRTVSSHAPSIATDGHLWRPERGRFLSLSLCRSVCACLSPSLPLVQDLPLTCNSTWTQIVALIDFVGVSSDAYPVWYPGGA